MRKSFFFPRLAVTGIHKNRRIYYPYLLTAILTTAMMYIIGSLERSSISYSGTLAFSLELGIFVTSAFSVIFLFYTNSFLMKRRKKEFGLYNILGMEKKHLALLLFWETLVLLLASLVLGLAAGVLLDKLMHMLLSRLMGETASLTFAISPESMSYTALLIGGTFALILLNAVRQVYFARPVELLRSAETGEREPKAKWVMTLLGLITLGAGYWISATVKNASMMVIYFFFAVLLVIAGTYLLFTSGSVTLLKALRANKRYYYKPDHFISVSGMIHRMKQNAVGLANVCILSTMVLVMVFATLSLWFGMQKNLDNRIRGDVMFDVYEQDISALETAVDGILADVGAQRADTRAFRYCAFAAFEQDGVYHAAEDIPLVGSSDWLVPVTFYALPLEDYNRMTGRSVTLAPDEALLECVQDTYAGDTLSVLGESFAIRERIRDGLGTGEAMVSIYDSFFLVVADMDTVERLAAKAAEVYGESAVRVRTEMSFALAGPPEARKAAASALEARLGELYSLNRFKDRSGLAADMLELYGGLLFVGLFLGALFTMAMILIVYYKQITEGYEDCERYRIMRKVGLSRQEIKRSISSQILIVFFLPLAAAGAHVLFAFPGIVTMFRALAMTEVRLIALCALGSFAIFAVIYGVVYLLTARVYYRIVSE